MGEDEAGTAKIVRERREAATPIVRSFGGRLVKTMGDGVLLEFPSVVAAVECAIAIQALTPQLNRELVEMDAPEVSFGIGLNTGEAVAAHFGGGRRRQYDVVGDTVNVGARLCSAAGRGEIILSDAVLSRTTSPPPVEPVGHIELKGVSRELRLWRVVAPESASLSLSVTAAENAVTVPET